MPTMRSREALVSSDHPEFGQALSLIEKLYRALSGADPNAPYIDKTVIQEAINFLEKHGRGGSRFE